MGALGKIRNRSGLLLTVIGFAMLAFILGDFMQSKRSGSSGTFYVGEVLGENIHVQNFEKTVDIGIENWKTQNPTSVLTQGVISNIRNQAWNQLTRELIMEEEYSKLGISISDDEWMERISGINVHPEVSKIQAFQDPNTGQFDRTKVLAYLQQVEQDQTGESVRNWLNFQDYLINVIRNAKYDKLIEKGTFINSEEAMISFNEGTQITTFDYISVPYTSVDDSLINITSKDIKKYYNENKEEKYKQDLSRDVEYVVFSVVPTLEDDNETKRSIENIKEDFANYDDYLTMVRRNSDNTRVMFNFQSQESMKNDSAFSSIISENKERIGKKLWTSGKDGEPVLIRNFEDDDFEAIFIAQKIKEFEKNGIPLTNVAILTRASFQFKDIEDRFLKENIKYRVVGGLRFYERAEIKDAVCYLRIINQKFDDLALERVIGVPKKGVGESTLKQIYKFGKDHKLCLEDSIMRLIEKDEFKPKIKIVLKQLIKMIYKWRADSKKMKHFDLLKIILDESGYSAMLKNKKDLENENRLENIKELLSAMKEFDNLENFLEHVSLATSVDQEWDGEKINMMTMHAAKGLEFDVVFLPGWEEGLFPHQKSIEEKGQSGLEEERRLAYVGITRAK